MADAVRIIEYQVVPWADLDGMGDIPLLLKQSLGEVAYAGILRCVTTSGRKITFAGAGEAASALVKTGAASNPLGTLIPKREFPVLVEGWPHRLRAG